MHEAPAAEAEPHLNVWTRLGLRVSRPRPPEVRAEAEGEVAAQVEEPVEVIVPRVESGAFRSSDEMFAEVGARLRERRETLNLRHEEIERHIHLRAHYLRALEEGDFGGLPSAVQTRGMLANYAAFLGLDVDELLLRFADVLQARHRERHPLPYGARGKPAPAAPASPPLFRSFLTVDLLGIGLALFLAAFLIWGVSFVAQKKEQARAATPVMLDALIEPTPSAAPGTPAPTSILLDLGNLTATLEPLEPPGALPTAPEGVNVQVNIIALERTFLRITVDGKVAFEGRVNPGTAYPFDAADQIEVLAGSGAALRVTYNQRDMGLLGGFGEVVNLIYRADGMVTPTPTIGPSPTVTPTPTATFTPTMTPSSTRTPTSTPTP
ncbi:MAG: DUF4115 domain-containing protein [Anaerolineales bacterium]|nr:MAG: DUF4115 domain-containing protein [Anaerolineales bacterium]